ncbi:MAG: hypothetical protein PHU75_10430 [Candidatus Nanopelagicales bacterium]|nr:hypothetical protein [Candidatus Nanopelagicales bacterium]
MDAVFLVTYVALVGLTYWHVRSTAWVVIVLAGSSAVVGAFISFALDRGHLFTRVQLQGLLVITLLLVLAATFVPSFRRPSAGGTGYGSAGGYDVRRQALTIWLPVALLLLAFLVVTTVLTKQAAFTHPVSFLIGHGVAEDNAKWLDFTSQFAAGGGISQPVPMGGPLELMLTFVGTVMGVVSSVFLGGYNQVAVAANSVVLGEFFMVALMALALAPLAEARFGGARLPAPFIWIGSLVLSTAALVSMTYGHLTLQFTFLIIGLWSATFLSSSGVPRARILTSIAAAAAMTVWLPLNVVAVVIIGGWVAIYLSRLVRLGSKAVDWVGAGLLAVVAIGIAQPVWSSIYYLLIGTSTASASGAAGAGAGAVAASLPTRIVTGIADSTLFSAAGGTEQVGPILGVLAVAVVLVAALSLTPIAGPLRTSLYRRFAPVGVMAFFAMAITLLDFWTTGSGPHYGSMKFTFLVAIVALATCLPIALRLIDLSFLGAMTPTRWIAVAGVVMLLMVDSVLPRALAQARPQQWSPPIPFDNPASYWYPAEVNGTGTQSILNNPVACVYLPKNAKAPTALTPDRISDAQRVYSCTRQLAGLSASDAGAQPIVDWLRREWFTNTPAWSDVYDGLAAMPAEVLNKPVILLDEGSNVIGLDSMAALLQRFPKSPETSSATAATAS